MKKKILFVNGHLNVGGVEKSLVDILNHFDYSKYSVDLLLFEDYGDYIDDIPPDVNVILFDITSTFYPIKTVIKNQMYQRNLKMILVKLILMLSTKVDQSLLRILKKFIDINNNYDCAIAFRPGFSAEFVANCINSNMKICWWHHGECLYDDTTKKRMNKTFSKFDTIVSVSKSCKLMIENYFENIQNKTIVIPNMVDKDLIIEKSKNTSSIIDEKNNFHFVTLGRLSPEKNVQNVIYISLELLKRDFYHFKWHIVGDGVERKNIKNLIKQYNLENNILLEGAMTNPYPALRQADLVIHTSLVESQCLTVLEALALDKVCIVTKSLGPEEFIESYVNGILTSDNPKTIADEIINVINNKKIYNDISNKSSIVIDNNYLPKKIMKKIYLLLEGRIN